MLYHAAINRHYYGVPIGILKFGDNTGFSIPGCVGNATTYDFPILLKPIEGLTFAKLCNKDKDALPLVIEAAKWLEYQGVRAITANCGFFALYQKEVADAVDIPVFLSSLLQCNFLTHGLRKADKLGIITANSDALDWEFLNNVGITKDSPVVIQGLQDKPCFRSHVIDENPVLDTDAVCAEVVEAAREMVEKDSAVKMILLECSELPPFAYAVQEQLGLPVYDFTTMINYMFSGLARKPFVGLN